MLYDAIIIGTGPAGLSAALNLQIHQKSFLWLGSPTLSDKVAKAEQINNYPGLHGLSGRALNEAFLAQVKAAGLTVTDRMVGSIMPMGERYAVLAGSDFYETKAIVLATGITNTGTLPGEQSLVGRGVSYCATCDGPLFRGKTVAVFCNNRRFEHEVAYLAELADTVYYFPTYRDTGTLPPNVLSAPDKPRAIAGEERVTGITLRSGETLPVDGVFCLRDSISLATLLPNLATQNGHIAVDRTMATNLPGVFAAGDCTGRPYQYAKAVGEGNVAAHSVIDYLARSAES